jgi:CheY-like chemotaxis protein
MESELKSRILLVDNNEELLQIYFRLLRSAGHDVCLAANGFDALSMARSCLPDLILLGSLLPNIERIELCQRLKADPALNIHTYSFFPTPQTTVNPFPVCWKEVRMTTSPCL